MEEENKQKSVIEEARELREQNIKLLDEMNEARAKLEEMTAQNVLAGRSGVSSQEEKKSYTNKEYAQAVLQNKILK